MSDLSVGATAIEIEKAGRRSSINEEGFRRNFISIYGVGASR
jgi:hypothetical protein